MPIFCINRHEGELKKSFQGSVLEGIERIKREEEERRVNEVEALPNRDSDESLCRSLFSVLCMTAS